MKKRLLAFFIAVICLIMPVLTSCSDEEAEVSMITKPVTVTLYGIKGEGTNASLVTKDRSHYRHLLTISARKFVPEKSARLK